MLRLVRSIRPCLKPHVRCFSVAKYTKFEHNLTEEDVSHLQVRSTDIMEDQICEIAEEEVSNYLLPIEKNPWDGVITRLAWDIREKYRGRFNASLELVDLVLERLDNQPLKDIFQIDEGFNQHCYFLFLHAWLIHRRLLIEGKSARDLDEKFMDHCWTVVLQWMLVKKIPEYRFVSELQHVQGYMVGFCVALDMAVERADILPARMQYVLWANVHSGSLANDHECVTLLTKYVIRQLSYLLMVPTENVLNGKFVWADMPVEESALIVRQPEYNYYLPKYRDKLMDFKRG